jgi:TonB dependent receptor
VPNPSKPEGALGDYRVNQIGVYVQDRWTPTLRLTLTAGLRLDVPYVPTPPTRNLALSQALGIDNTLTPSGNALWAPRLGFSYDLGGRGAFLRGGLGLFSGRPAYHWFNSVYQLTGLEDLELECFGSDVPAFTADPANQPTSCPSAEGPKAFVAYFNPDFRFPRNLRASLGADVRLPWGTIGTVDLLYIRGVNDFYVTDVNLIPTGIAAGEGGRILYGTFDASGQATPNRPSYEFERVNELRNARGNRSYLATVRLQKRFVGGEEIGLAYTYTDSKDRLSAASDLAVFNVADNPLDGPIDDRRLRTSSYSVPHKITVVGAVDLPLRARFSLFYIGYSGQPYTYVIQGDADAERYGHNDIVYVPTDAADITLADRRNTPSWTASSNQSPASASSAGGSCGGTVAATTGTRW